jgi:2'-5' RNA ligase
MIVAALALVAGDAKSEQRPESTQPAGDRVIAIDVLLPPDAKMVAKSEAANARLRENYPKGYTLGKEQVPHITLVHAYVREKDLSWLESTVSLLADATQPQKLELTATGYSYAIWSGVAITGISIERSKRLEGFEENVAKAVDDVAIANGTAAAFSTTRELPTIDKEIVDYVKNFAVNSTGKGYKPHVTVGVAHEDFAKQLKAELFEKFSFKASGVAIYQLGNFGTAQKKLWEWHAK